MSNGVPAVFLDRDGVLIEDTGYPHLESQLRMMPGAGEAVGRLNRLGYLCVIVTNQSGVARGLFTEQQMHAFNQVIVRRLALAGGRIGAVYACPYHSEGRIEAYLHPDHPDRKPNPGMLLRAAADHDIDMARSFMIGDQPSSRAEIWTTSFAIFWGTEPSPETPSSATDGVFPLPMKYRRRADGVFHEPDLHRPPLDQC
jgi:D-glycero-D-manno-heptose 1,7-bisphosphate phosphatase